MPSPRRRPRAEDRAPARPGPDRAAHRLLKERLTKLARSMDRADADLERTRGRLAALSAELGGGVPGFRALQTQEQVLPFRDAARRYLLEATQLFGGDPRGLARALGVSYFALRRLLARYDVPFPAARARR